MKHRTKRTFRRRMKHRSRRTEQGSSSTVQQTASRPAGGEEKYFISCQEAGDMIGTSSARVRSMLLDGTLKLPYLMVGNTMRINYKPFMRMVEKGICVKEMRVK